MCRTLLAATAALWIPAREFMSPHSPEVASMLIVFAYGSDAQFRRQRPLLGKFEVLDSPPADGHPLHESTGCIELGM